MPGTDPDSIDVTPASGFRLEDRDVVLEAFPDETIAVHLGTGRYFSLDLMGAEILELLVSGRTLGAVVDHLAARYHADRDDVEPVVREYARGLLDEGLVTRAPGGAETESGATFAEPPCTEGEFRAPTLAVYSDMEDLLLLDPIHDVDDTGWPVRATNEVSRAHDE